MKKRKINLIAILLILVLSGCVRIPTENTQTAIEPTQTTMVAVTPTVEYTQTPSPSATNSPTMTITPTIEKKTREEVDAWLLEKVYEPECDLPCFWGITPGETSWRDVVEEVSPYADEVENGREEKYYHYSFFFYSPPEEITTGILFLGIDYQLEKILKVNIGLVLENVSSYSLPAVLLKYGPPGEVWITAYSGYAFDDRDPRPSTMYVLYPEMGLLLTYAGPPGEVDYGIVKNCIEWGPSLEIWAPGELPSMEAFDERFAYMWLPYLHVDEALGMDVNAFYEAYQGEPGDVCFETPANLWTWGESETDQ